MNDIPSPVPAPGASAASPGISRAIYGMPMFATLTARDVHATVAWFVEGLGFVDLFRIPGPDGEPVLVHLRRWQFQDVLVRPAGGDVVPSVGFGVGFAAVHGEIDALAERARACGLGTVEGPVDTPWNTREVSTTDPDGNVIAFTAPRPPEQADAAFSERMTLWSAAAGLRR